METWALKIQNDRRAKEYDQILWDLSEDDSQLVTRAVLSAREFGIDEETISVALDAAEEEDLVEGKTANELPEMEWVLLRENRKYEILPWIPTISGQVTNISLPDYYRGHPPEAIVAQAEIWGTNEDIVESLLESLDGYYADSPYYAQQGLEEFSSEEGDEKIRVALMEAIQGHDLQSIQDEYEMDEDGYLGEYLPQVYVQLTINKELDLDAAEGSRF